MDEIDGNGFEDYIDVATSTINNFGYFKCNQNKTIENDMVNGELIHRVIYPICKNGKPFGEIIFDCINFTIVLLTSWDIIFQYGDKVSYLLQNIKININNYNKQKGYEDFDDVWVKGYDKSPCPLKNKKCD